MAHAAPPGPVTDLVAHSGSLYRADIELYWRLPADADEALVCWRSGSTPPVTPGPPELCGESDIPDGGETSFRFVGIHGNQYAFSVFSRTSAMGEYGPPVSVVVVAHQSPPPGYFEEMDDIGSRTSIKLCWSEEDAGAADAWTMWMVPGAAPAPAGAAPVAILRGGKTTKCYRAKGLKPDSPYTFTFAGRNEGGTGPARTLTAATRTPGTYVAGPRRASARIESNADAHASTFVRRTGEIHTAFLRHVRNRSRSGIFYALRRRSGPPTQPLRLSARRAEPLIASNEAGALAVAWNRGTGQGSVYRYRAAGDDHWGPEVQIATDFGHLDAMAMDRAGRLHFLLIRGADVPSPVIHYRTNATGRWTQTGVRGSFCRGFVEDSCGNPLMTYDPVTDRLVLVAAPKPRRILIAAKPAGSTTFGPLYERYRPGPGNLKLIASSVTSFKGRITVALRTPQHWIPGDTSRDGLFVMTGNTPARVSAPVRVPGTGPRDVAPTDFGGFLVAAATRDRVLLAWQRDTALTAPRRYVGSNSWDPDQQGIWIRHRVRDPRTGRWTFKRPEHRTNSAYDMLKALLVDSRSRAHVVHNRLRFN